jgi:hypothetical protein
MDQRFEPRQIEEAAGPFDCVDEAKDIVEDLRVVGVLLKAHELDVDDVDALVRLSEEVPQQLVHDSFQARKNASQAATFWERKQCVGKGFNFRAWSTVARRNPRALSKR